MSNNSGLERRVANLEQMIQVTKSLRASFDLQSLLQQIIEAIVELANCERGSILLTEPRTGELRFVAVSGTEYDVVRDVTVPLHGSIAGTILQTQSPLLIHRVQDDPRFFPQVDQFTGLSTDSILGVPLEIGGRVIGVLEAMNKKQGEHFDEEDAETLLVFASQAAAAIENSRLIEEQRERLTEVMLLQDVLQTLSRFIRVDQLLDRLLDLLEEWLGYSNLAIWLPDKERSALHVSAYRGFDGTDIGNRMIVPGGHSLCSRAASERQPLYIGQLKEGTHVTPILPSTQSALAVPMMGGETSDLVGVIGVESSLPDAFDDRDMRLVSTIAAQAAVGIRQAELYEDSRRANRLKQEFIATMSHELRTPLTVLIGYCDMLTSESLGPINEAQRSALQVIHGRSDLLLRLLNDVLDFSKIASGQLELRPALINLQPTISSVVDKLRSHTERKHQPVSVDIAPDCQYVVGDHQRLRQVLEHLLDNASKFSPQHRPIAIRVRPHDSGYVRIDVSDRGIGIKPEDVELIFEDFRQLDSSFTRDYGGAGMGLSVCKHLVELQGGLIWVESQFGVGSTFSFILPSP
jgi:signal transduction histidine kinase